MKAILRFNVTRASLLCAGALAFSGNIALAAIKASGGAAQKTADVSSAPTIGDHSLKSAYFKAVLLDAPGFLGTVVSPVLGRNGQVIAVGSSTYEIFLWENGIFKNSAIPTDAVIWPLDIRDDGVMLGYEQKPLDVGYSLMHFAGPNSLVRNPISGFYGYRNIVDGTIATSGGEQYIKGGLFFKTLVRFGVDGRVLVGRTDFANLSADSALEGSISWLDLESHSIELISSSTQHWGGVGLYVYFLSHSPRFEYLSSNGTFGPSGWAVFYEPTILGAPFSTIDLHTVAIYSPSGFTKYPKLNFSPNERPFWGAINEHGQAAGGILYEVGSEQKSKALVWEKGVVQELDSEGYSGVIDMNKYGQAVGSSATVKDQDTKAVLWENGVRVNLSARLISPLPGGEVLETAFAINDRGDILAYSDSGDLYHLMPVWLTTKFVDRDFPENTWTSATDLAPNAAVYAGELNGDMVEWKVPHSAEVALATFSWTAEGPSGEHIAGPTGVGKDQWSISDADDDLLINWLTWKPGSYTIKCVVTLNGRSVTIEQNQIVGWRTDEYVIVGQVKPLNDVQLTDSQKSLLKANLVTDLAGALNSPIPGGLIFPPVELSSLAWFGAQAITSSGFTVRRVANLPDVGEAERLWMMQNGLNSNPDLIDLPSEVTTADLFELNEEQSYRMYSRSRFKYSVTQAGKLAQVISAPISSATTGPTKITIPTAARTAFNWIAALVDNSTGVPISRLPEQIVMPSEIATSTTTRIVDRKNGTLASFVGGRVGLEARYANYALFQRSVPYIFAETILGLDEDRKATEQTIRLSVDKVWTRPNGETGSRFFNEIRIYRRNGAVAGAPFELIKEYTFTANPGMLREFILSVPINTWPGEEPNPITKDLP